MQRWDFPSSIIKHRPKYFDCVLTVLYIPVVECHLLLCLQPISTGAMPTVASHASTDTAAADVRWHGYCILSLLGPV